MAEKNFKNLIAGAKQRDSYWAGRATHNFTEDLYALMMARGVSKAELARRIGSSAAYVTKALRGNTNFTIESMVRLVRALDGQLHIHASRQEDHVRWFDAVGKKAECVSQESMDEYHLIEKSHAQKQLSPEVGADESYPTAA